MTQSGTAKLARMPDATSRAVISPTAFWPSLPPCAAAWRRHAKIWSGWKIRCIRFCREWRKRWVTTISKRNAVTMPRIGEMKMNMTTTKQAGQFSTPATIRIGMIRAPPQIAPSSAPSRTSACEMLQSACKDQGTGNPAVSP